MSPQIRRVQGVSTGVAFIGVNAEGNNSIIVVQERTAAWTRHIWRENHSLLEACDIVVMQLEIPLDSVMYAAKEAKRLGKTVILTRPRCARFPKSCIKNVDIVKPNEVELGELLGDPEAHRRLEESCKKAAGFGRQKRHRHPGRGGLLPLQRRRAVQKILCGQNRKGGGHYRRGRQLHSGHSLGAGRGPVPGGGCGIRHQGFQYCSDPERGADLHPFPG